MNTKAFTVGIVGLLCSIFVASILLPEIITQVQDVNTTAWTFTGHAGAATLWELIALMAVIGIFLGVIGWALKSTGAA